MQRIYGVVIDANGNASANASVTVYIAGGNTLATLYSPDGTQTPTTTITNPITADALGRYVCAVANGHYKILESQSSGPTRTLDWVSAVDATDAVNPSGYTTNLGTVTSAAVTTANGVSATVATATTIPTFTFTLGAITPSTVNGLTLTSVANGFTILGGTSPKTMTFPNSLTISGTDGSTLNVGTGGTLGTAAYVAIASYAPIANPTFTGVPAAPTVAAATNTTQIATTAFSQAMVQSYTGRYNTLMMATGSHIAGQVAGTYAIQDGTPLAVSGTGTLAPMPTIYLIAAQYPNESVGTTAKLNVSAQLYVNDVALFTGTFIVGLYPFTRPGTSGGVGVNIYTLGTVVPGSQVTFTNPAADLRAQGESGLFTLPADGFYCLGVITSATVAANSLAHVTAQLKIANA